MKSKTTTIIEQFINAKRVANLMELRKNPCKSEYEDKIYKYIEKYGNIWTYSDIIKEIKASDMVASIFSKDPTKENKIGGIVANLLSGSSKIHDFKLFAKSGADSMRIGIDGDFFIGSDKKSLKNHTKSIDFFFKNNKGIYYCTQKFTRGIGGSQDKNCQEVIDYLKFASRRQESGTYFVGLLDGDYFTDDKINQINKEFELCSNVFVCSADYFLD